MPASVLGFEISSSPNAISLPSWLRKNHLGNLLKINIIGLHPLTFPCRSKVGLGMCFSFSFFKISTTQYKKYTRRLYGEKQFFLSSVLHPLSFLSQRQLL